MPAKRPRASFDPISPYLDLDALVEDTPNFQYVDRISCDTIDQQGLEAFDKLVLLHVVVGGKPLVIDGYQSRLDPWTFSPKWLQQNLGEKVEHARDLRKDNSYTPLTIGHYLRNLGRLAEQYYEKPDNYKDLTRQRVYLKDIDCPEVWYDKLKEHLPQNLFYLNESCGDIGGPGSVDENASAGGKKKGRGIAGAGDLMSSLPRPMRAENMMCYIGHEGTYTPAHKEMCATIGHNIMVDVSDVLGEDGKPERPGSSIWFMTESKDRHTVAEYWLSILGHDIEVERHFAQINAWKAGNFTTYVVDQRPGDLILIPPMAPHQVWNRGTRTMKAAWNRTTVETLEMAFEEALPNARMVCRDEQYKNKAIVYYTLQRYSSLLAKAKDQQQTAPSPQEAAILRTSPKIRQLQKDFKRLFRMFKEIMLSEMFSPDNPHEKNVEFFPFDSNITCAYCRGNIFNKFLTCKTCDDQLGTSDPEPYDVCMHCYTMGRSCGCISKLRWAEQFKWKELGQKYETWRRLYVELEGGILRPDTPLTLQEERARLTTKTLAQVCQEQLKRRPWVDVHKTVPKNNSEDEDEEIEINDDGTVKKKKKRRSEAWLKNNHACHVCCHRHENWKMAGCKCGRWWCYGSLFRGYDTMPQEIMADPDWRCPHCKGVCFAGACRKDPRQKPYEPKGTLLGWDTRKVADARSVESLVDFSVSNLNWLKEGVVEAPMNSHRLQRRQEEAERAKEMDITLDAHYATEDEDDGVRQGEAAGIHYSPDRSMIDPQLVGAAGASTSSSALRSPSEITTNRRNNPSTVPDLAALLNGGDEGSSYADHDGYQPAQQAGYIAPSAVMINVPDAEGEEEDLPPYPELDGLNDEGEFLRIDAAGKKRKRASAGDAHGDGIKRLPAKKSRRATDGDALPGATKQYRREQERKALEEARKAGRFIQLHAALRGKSRVVKLKLGHANTARIAAQEAEEQAGAGNDLLKSDVAPVQSVAGPKVVKQTTIKPSKAVRIRVERDDDFGARRRGKTDKDGKPIARTEEPLYEEVDIDSDDSVLGNGRVGTAKVTETAVEITDTGGKRRRTSAWQSRRHQESDDEFGEELDALPNDWKDRSGRVRRPRPTAGKAANGEPGLPTASVAPRITAGKSVARIRPSVVDLSDDDVSEEEPTVAGEGADESEGDIVTVASHTTIAALALKRANEAKNQRAKLEAAGLARNGAEDTDDDGDETFRIKAVASALGPIAKTDVPGAGTAGLALGASGRGGSFRGRGGPGGRRGKIVGSRSKANGHQTS